MRASYCSATQIIQTNWVQRIHSLIILHYKQTSFFVLPILRMLHPTQRKLIAQATNTNSAPFVCNVQIKFAWNSFHQKVAPNNFNPNHIQFENHEEQKTIRMQIRSAAESTRREHELRMSACFSLFFVLYSCFITKPNVILLAESHQYVYLVIVVQLNQMTLHKFHFTSRLFDGISPAEFASAIFHCKRALII